MADKPEMIIALNGGANQDESVLNPPAENEGVSSFAVGDYRYVLNMRIGSSVSNNIGAAELINGTLAITNYYTWNGTAWVDSSLPAGTSTAISKKEDKQEGKIYWAVHNTSGNHQVLMFVKRERKVYELLKWSGLNFQLTKYVSMCKIGKFLVLADKYNPNRILNVNTDITSTPVDTTQIFRLKQTLASNFSEFHISFAKWPPLSPPVIKRSLTETAADNVLLKGLKQFAYRYVYYSGFKSTWSPWSHFVSNEYNEITNPAFEISVNGFLFDYNNPSNTSFDHDSIKFYSLVQYIEFAYRESTRGTWTLFKRLATSSTAGANKVVTLNNLSGGARVPSRDIYQPFDSVPFKSGACESIDSRVMLGDNEDELLGFTDFDVEDVEVYEAEPGVNNSWNPATNTDLFTSLSVSERAELKQLTDIRRFSFKERGVYKLGIIGQTFNGRTTLVTTLDKLTYRIPPSAASPTTIVEKTFALGFNIPSSVVPPSDWVSYQIVRSNCLNIEYFVWGVVNNFKFLQNDTNALNDDISTPTNIKSLMNDYFDNNPLVSVASKLFKKKFSVSQRTLAEIRKNKAAASLSAASRIYMDISNWVTTSKKDAGATLDWPGNNVYYQFQQGDRVRFRGSTSANYNNSDLVVFDEEIVEFTGKGIIVNKPSTLVTLKDRSGALPNPSSAFIIEIYRPKEYSEEDDVIFNEIGEWYPILQPGTAARDFAKRDFRWTSAGDVTLITVNGNKFYKKMPIFNGDVHSVSKDFYYEFASATFNGQLSGLYWPQLTQDKTSAFDYWERNTGRELVAYRYLPTEIDKPTQVRFSGRYLEDSLFLSINNFRDENQHYYPAEYGRIRALVNTANAQVESVGAILLVLGEVEAWSIYVNRRTLEDLAGSTSVELSNKVLGSYNTLLGGKACLNPDSVSVRNGRVLWWNAKTGEWIRYSRDGLTEISKVKMKGWFKDLADLLIDEYSSTPPKVLSTFDDYHECWMTFINHSSLPATFRGYSSYKCVTFAERNADKRWKEWIDYAPELFAAMDNEVYSIIGSRIHIHEEGASQRTFYGVAKDAIIEVVGNVGVRQNKVLQAVALVTSDKWSFESIKGDWKSNGITRQETRLRLDDLVSKENTYWSAVKRDKNTPNTINEQHGLIDGEMMRSKTFAFTMKLDPGVSWLSLFHYLVVEYDESPLNPKK